jgi:hypothetical protein
MKKLLFTVLLSSACLIAQPPEGRWGGPMGFGPGPDGPGGPRMGRIVTGAPYSAVEVTVQQQALAGGNVIQRQTTTNISRDSQGRVYTESEFTRPGAAAGQTPVKRITISDPVAGYVHEVDPQKRVVTSRATRPANGSQTASGPRPAGAAPRTPRAAGQTDPNVVTESLGTQTVNGVIATGTRVTRTIPAGTMGNALPIQSVRETWVSADLKEPVMIKSVDPRFGTRTTQLTNINRVEPDPSLFQVPADYTVQKPGPGGRGLRRAGPGASGGQIQ